MTGFYMMGALVVKGLSSSSTTENLNLWQFLFISDLIFCFHGFLALCFNRDISIRMKANTIRWYFCDAFPSTARITRSKILQFFIAPISSSNNVQKQGQFQSSRSGTSKYRSYQRRYSIKKLFLKILQYSKENNFVGICF